MMEQVYQALLHLLPSEFREQFGSEMRGVFAQAADEARNHGPIAYGAFAIREIAGLLTESFVHRTQLPKRALLVPACMIAGFLVSLLALSMLGPAMYTSVALVRLAPQSVSERLIPETALAGKTNLLEIVTRSINRPSLVLIINTFGLYEAERRRLPMEAVVERMKHGISIAADNDARGATIRFRHTEPEIAQKVSDNIANRVITEFQRIQTQRTALTEQFLTDQTEAAATEWQRQLKLRGDAGTASSERQSLDVNLARNQYVSLKEKLAAAKLSRKLQESRQGPAMEMLAPASLPGTPDRNHKMIVIVGTLAGGLIGVLWAWLRPLSWRTPAAVHPGQ